MLQGRFFSKEEVEEGKAVVVIDQKLAELNNLSLGSLITVYIHKNNVPGALLTLEVIGIYEDNGQEAPYIGFSMFLRGNTLHMPYTTLQSTYARFSDYSNDYLSAAYYYLHDPLDYDKFVAEAKEMGIDFNILTLDMSDKSFTKITAPMNKLVKFTKTGVIATLVTGAFIMILLMTIIIRERKTEVGILRALGSSRATVAVQFIAESLLICAIALCLGLVCGHALSQKAADSLLSKEVAQAEANNTNSSIVST